MSTIRECIDIIENSSANPSYKYDILRKLKSIEGNGTFVCQVVEQDSPEQYQILLYKNGLKQEPERAVAKYLGFPGFINREWKMVLLVDGEYILFGA